MTCCISGQHRTPEPDITDRFVQVDFTGATLIQPGLRSQTESPYVQTVPDGKCLCPDRPRRKVPMSRLSRVHQTFVLSCPDFRAFTRLSCVHVQTFVRSPDFRAFISRLLCVQQTFVRSPDFRAFTKLSCVHVQTFVRSYPDFRAFTRLSCVHQTFVRSSDFRVFTRLYNSDELIFAKLAWIDLF